MEKFNLFHLALYAKGWYKKFDTQGRGKRKNVWDDLKVIMKLDGYNGEHMRVKDIIGVTLDHFQRLGLRAAEMAQFAEGISPDECWRFGCYTKDHKWVRDHENLPDYNQNEAIIQYVLSSLRFTSATQLGVEVLPMPDYKNGLPRNNGNTDKRLKEFFSPKTETA